MAKEAHIIHLQNSKLAQLDIGFEYNKTWRDVKKEVRERTYTS